MSDGSHLTARRPPEGARHHLLVDVVGDVAVLDGAVPAGGRRDLSTIVRSVGAPGLSLLRVCCGLTSAK